MKLLYHPHTFQLWHSSLSLPHWLFHLEPFLSLSVIASLWTPPHPTLLITYPALQVFLSFFVYLIFIFPCWIKTSTENPSSCHPACLYKNPTLQDKRLLKIIPALGFPISQRFSSEGSVNLRDVEYWIWRWGSATVFFQHVCSVNSVLLDLQVCRSGWRKRPHSAYTAPRKEIGGDNGTKFRRT